MTPFMIVSGFVLGTAVGVLSGLIGLGGGVVLIPALALLYGMSQKMAQGTSLATMLLPIGIFAFWEYHKAGQTNVRLAAVIALGFLVGGYFGGQWAQGISEVVLRRAFAVLLFGLAIKFAFWR